MNSENLTILFAEYLAKRIAGFLQPRSNFGHFGKRFRIEGNASEDPRACFGSNSSIVSVVLEIVHWKAGFH